MDPKVVEVVIKVLGELVRLVPIVIEAVSSGKSTEELILQARAAVPQPLNAEAQALVDAAKARVGTP